MAAAALAVSPGSAAAIERRLGEVVTGERVKATADESGYKRAAIDALKKIGGPWPL